MKKAIMTLGVAAIALSFSSCRKNYDCTYEYELLGVKYTSTSTCTKCNKDDVKKLEDAGWVCE